MTDQNLHELYKDICLERDLRQKLITLKSMLADEATKRRFVYLLEGKFDTFTALLHHEDPKVRKNTARILGEMETEDVLPFLFEAYMNEETLFVRADYLRAMKGLDIRRFMKPLKEQRDALLAAQVTEEERKHRRDELQMLDSLISRFEKTGGHVFVMPEKDVPDVLVVTGPGRRELTEKQIITGTVTKMHSALRVSGGDLEELCRLRTYQELLFPVPLKAVLKETDPEKLGRKIAKLDIPNFLDRFHTGTGAYRYRLDIRGSQEVTDKGKMIRKATDALDLASEGKLRNSISDYEVEIRLLARKDGGYVPVLKLFTMEDKRFAYRKHFLADSIAPANAAAVMEAAKPYLTDHAQVLDPFCGVGIMLTERRYALGAADTYGVDYRAEAIEKAKENTQISGMMIHYVNRDYFSFSHTYLFDELVTDLPAKGYGNLASEAFYTQFFIKSYNLLKNGGVMVLYTTDPAGVCSCMGSGYRILHEQELNEKTKASVLVLKKI